GPGEARHRPRPPRAGDLLDVDGRGEPAGRARRSAQAPAGHTGAHLWLFSGAEGDAARTWRRPLRWPTAAAGDRAGADVRAQAPDPRRTDGGHPTEHRAPDRGHPDPAV